VIITHFNIKGIAIDELETDTPFVIDGNRMLAQPFAFESVQPVARRGTQILQSGCEVYILKLPHSPPSNVWRESARHAIREQVGRPFVREGLDHSLKSNASRDTCQTLKLCQDVLEWPVSEAEDIKHKHTHC
jgi:hypothetical protein